MEEKEQLIPKMYIKYMDINDKELFGDFEHIPKGAIRAKIISTFPIVNSYGRFQIRCYSYSLYIGIKYDISNSPKKIELSKKEIIDKYKSNNIYNVVLCGNNIYPLSYEDAVFENFEQMLRAISYINITFNSVCFSTQNLLDINKGKSK